MNKKILLLIVFLLLLTGCKKDKTMTCNKETTTDNNLVMKSKMEITYNDEKVVKVINTTTSDLSKTTYNTDKFINTLIESSNKEAKELNKIKGISLKYEKIKNGFKSILEIEYDDLDEKEIKKYQYTLYSKKDIKIDELKTNFLKDYECK